MIVNELRLGNLVNEKVLGVCPVVQITKDSVWVEINNLTTNGSVQKVSYHISEGNIKGVPLTESWLIKFGLKDTFLQWSLHKIFNKEGYSIYKGHGCIDIEIYYVHQLQNLFFVLSGKELELNKK